MSIENLTPTQLRQAADLQDKIDTLKSQLAAIFGSEVKSAPAAAKQGGMSAEGRARIVAAQKARWAKVHASQPAKAAPAAKKKGGMSAEGRARIVAAQKARWAKIKAAKGK